jgi:hypothetical protein
MSLGAAMDPLLPACRPRSHDISSPFDALDMRAELSLGRLAVMKSNRSTCHVGVLPFAHHMRRRISGIRGGWRTMVNSSSP